MSTKGEETASRVAHRRRLGLSVAALLLLLPVVLWLLDAGGHGAPVGLDRLSVALAATVVAVLAGRALRRRHRDGERALLGLLALSFALHFTGLEHEIGGRYFGDEGAYLAQAQRINDGQLLRGWFIYPHLLFYLNAFALWVAGLFAPAVGWVAQHAYGIEGELPVAALVSRWVSATCGALTVLPVYALGRRLGGPVAAVAAGVLFAFSPLWLEIAHLNLGDVPAAFFATLALAASAALLERESTRGYLLAGLAAGLAAGSKYPAGLSAIAIAAVYLRHRLATRRLHPGLAWAALAALAAFLAATPSLLAYREALFEGGADLFFGARLYAEAGWAGVVRGSNLLYYGQQLVASFGIPLMLLGAVGLAGLPRPAWRRLAWLAPFPVAFLVLILVMQIVVPRNLLPVLPAMAAALGAGAAGWLRWSERLQPKARRAVLVLLAAACLAQPVLASSGLLTRLARPTTRDVAAAWTGAHLPPGAFIIQEAYTPQLPPESRFQTRKPRFAFRLSDEELTDPAYDFLFLSSESYNRFLRGRTLVPGNEEPARRYQAIFDRFELLRHWRPGRWQAGPELRLYRLDPAQPLYVTERRFTAAEATLNHPDAMRPKGAAAVTFHRPEQWALVKGYLAAGRYQLSVEPAAAGRLRVTDRANATVAELLLPASGTAELTLPQPEKYFLYLTLEPGSRLAAVALERPAADDPSAEEATRPGDANAD